MHVQSSTSPPAIPIPMITTTSSSVPASVETHMRGANSGKGFERGPGRSRTPARRNRTLPPSGSISVVKSAGRERYSQTERSGTGRDEYCEGADRIGRGYGGSRVGTRGW